MNALGGSLAERARAAFAAGLDVALHCNGDLAEARAVAEASPRLEGARLRRAEAALERVADRPQPFDADAARAELDAALPLELAA